MDCECLACFCDVKYERSKHQLQAVFLLLPGWNCQFDSSSLSLRYGSQMPHHLVSDAIEFQLSQSSTIQRN